MVDDVSANIDRLVTELEFDGCLSDPAWQAAFRQTPRHLFIPAYFESLPDGRWQAVDSTSTDYWRQVYADTTLTTQLDGRVDPHPSDGPLAGTGTSSSTQPGLMAYMLDALAVSGGERVLEIGTGTGYNAALLSHRLGAENVTTVEIDPHVTSLARQRLTTLGYAPTVVNGNGDDGWADNAPYDRLIATCSVPTIPRAWIEQIADGGNLVTSLWRDLGGGPLVRLEVDKGHAQGFFLRQPGGFMPTRTATKATPVLSAAVKQSGEIQETDVPSSVLREADAGLWLALLVPRATWLGFTPNGGNEQLWLFSADESWAMVEDATMRVEQFGPRKLWDEVENAYRRWKDAGSPERDRLGLTVTENDQYSFWLDQPQDELWRDGT